MARPWTQQRLEGLIRNETEESLTLEYKSAEALARVDQNKKEITKDVSAMANSAGGTLIYGIREHGDPNKKHLPEKIVPVNRVEFSREWLEQIIQSIRPRIEGIVIHSVTLDSGPNDVAYAVEVPQSNTAHQASNHRYYKRFNFQSVPMEDYEIRDVILRESMPDVEVRFLVEIRNSETNLIVQATNNGSTYARFVAVFVDVPVDSLLKIENRRSIKDGGRFYRHRLTNFNQEYADETFRANFPLLRSMTMSWKIPLKNVFEDLPNDVNRIKWKVYADNAKPKGSKNPDSRDRTRNA